MTEEKGSKPVETFPSIYVKTIRGLLSGHSRPMGLYMFWTKDSEKAHLKKEIQHISVLNHLSHHSQINRLLTSGEGINSYRRIFSLAKSLCRTLLHSSLVKKQCFDVAPRGFLPEN